MRTSCMVVALAVGAARLGAAEAAQVLTATGGTIVAVAAGVEPDRAGTGSRLVVVTSGWTDLEQSVAGGAWQAAPAREVIWDEGGVRGAATWDLARFDASSDASFAVRLPAPGTERTLEMVNVSGRAGFRRSRGDIITGFVFEGASRTFLIRAAGPALVPFGVIGAMVNPTVTIYDRNRTVVASVDDWDTGGRGDEIAAVSAGLGAFAFARGSADAALLVDLPAGVYTVVAGSRDGDEGITLIEAYAVPEAGLAGSVMNLSLRARVESGDRVAIPGFITEGNSNRRYLVRAVGPGLAPFGVSQPLPNPKVTIMQGGVAVASNDDWGASLAVDETEAAASRLGAFSLDRASRDSAVLLALPPGPFTVVVEDATGSGAQGEVLIEAYLVPPG